MDTAWQKIDGGGEQIATLMGLGHVGSPLVEQLLLAPASTPYLRVEVEIPSARPGELGLLVPKTQLFFNVKACKELRGDAMVALAAYLATHSFPAAAVAAGLRKLGTNLKRLTDEEAVVVRIIVHASGGNPYEEPVAEELVRARHHAPELVDALLDALEDKGVVKHLRGGRLLLVY